MTGHRRAMNCRFVIVPPPGDWRVVVLKERRVAGEVFFKKGHTPLDWWRRASISRFSWVLARRFERLDSRGRGEKGREGGGKLIFIHKYKHD